MRDRLPTRARKKGSGKRACAIPTKCDTPASEPHFPTAEKWEEFVIRYDPELGRYVTRTACCPGAPICC